MACESILEVAQGTTISGNITGSNLDDVDFFLLFYVGSKGTTKVSKSEMTMVEPNSYNWIILPEISKNMSSGITTCELWLVNAHTAEITFTAFNMLSTRGKNELISE